MKFQCADGVNRDFELIQEKLIRYGFDPVLLSKDDNLVSTSFPPNTGVLHVIKLARLGITLPIHIYHWSKRSKKINPISIPLDSLVADIEWISFLPSIEVDKETSLHGKQDWITWLARALTKVFRWQSKVKDKSSFRTMIFGENINNFQFNYGYKFIGMQYIETAKEEFLFLSDTDESLIAVHPTLLGYVNKVMIC